MLRSRAVAKVKPSSFCSTVLILGIGLGIGKGFIINLLLTSQKSPLGKHGGSLLVLYTMAMSTLNSAAVQVPPVCTVAQLPWWGHPCVFLVLGKLGHDMVKHLLSIWKKTGLVFQSPKMPSESDSNLKRRCSNFFWWSALRCLQLFYTINWRSAFCIFGT